MNTFGDLFSFGFDVVPKQRCLRSLKSVRKEVPGASVLEFSVPGCDEEDVSVEVEDDCLIITATIQGSEVTKTYILPSRCDVDTLEAKIEKGLLTVTIPENKKRRKIL